MTGPLAVPIRAAAKRLGAGRDATYQLVRSGRLRVIKVGGRQLVPVVELERFVERELLNGHPEGGEAMRMGRGHERGAPDGPRGAA